MIAASLREYGAGRSILVDKRGRIIAGNKTAAQAANAGLTDVVVVRTDGKSLVAVQRTDLDLEADGAAKALAIADNRSAEISLDWDGDVLASMAGEVDLEQFFGEAELRGLIGVVGAPDEQVAATDAELDGLQAKWATAAGQLWQCGAHRVLCGDSTVAANVVRLLGEANPNLMVTDPPYGVQYDPEWRVRYDGSPRHSTGKVANDGVADWSASLALFQGNVAYVWHGGVHAAEVAAGLGQIGFDIRAQIIWRKAQLVISRGHYHWQHEPCWYAVRKGKRSGWVGDRKQSTIWDVEAGEQDEASGHGTQKPNELFVRPMVNHTAKGDAVYDPFLGSGTALVAAESIGRICYGVDLDPRYVAVALERASRLGLDCRLAE